MGIKTEIYGIFKSQLKETIENITYIRELMENNKLKEKMRQDFKDEILSLEAFGIEF
jgi:hypothetical protein